jgi:hypothetical protein
MTNQDLRRLLAVLEYGIDQDNTSCGEIGVLDTKEDWDNQKQILAELKEKLEEEIKNPSELKLKISTDKGVLTAKVDTDVEYPSIDVYLEGYLVTSVECNGEEIRAIVYADSEEEDYTHKITIN